VDFQLVQAMVTDVGTTMAEFAAAYFAVNSRSVFVEPAVLKNLPGHEKLRAVLSDEPTMCLAPFLDLINHNPVVNTRPEFTTKDGELTYALYSATKFRKYEQVFINYGSHNNTKLLLEYGFIVPNNPHDFIELTLQDITNYIKLDPELRALPIPRQKFVFIKEHNLHEQLFFDLTDGMSHNLVVVLTILFVEKNIHNMRQIAFGQSYDTETVAAIGLRFVDYKRDELEQFRAGLTKLGDTVSPSAIVCIEYFEECSKFLLKIKEFL
jgi:hypothetical protein